MPTILKGFVDIRDENDDFYLVGEKGQDVMAEFFKRYAGKKIDLVISVREHP